MRRVAAVVSGGVLVPDGAEWGPVLYSLQTGAEYRLIEEGLTPYQSESPSDASATSEAVQVYRKFYSRPNGRLMVGCTESNTAGLETRMRDTIEALCGAPPAILTWEFEDAASGKQAAGIDGLLSHHFSGGLIGIHHHPENPVTSGVYSDRSGAPLAAIKSGGSHHAQYLSYLDQIASVISALSPAAVIYRPFHEVNGDWFWWGGADRSADMVVVWRETVDYIRNTKGLHNVLFSWNIHGNVSNGGVTDNAVTAYSTWWPGAQYVDLISMDIYDETPSHLMTKSGHLWKSWNALLKIAVENNRPIYIAEIGSQSSAQDVAGFWYANVFEQIGHTCPGCSAIVIWNGAWAPAAGTAGAESFAEGVREFGCLLGDIE